MSPITFPDRHAHGKEVVANSFSEEAFPVARLGHSDEQMIAIPEGNGAFFQRPKERQISQVLHKA